MEPIKTNQFEPIGIGKRIFITKEEEVQSVDQKTGEMFYMKKIPAMKEVSHDSLVYTKVFTGGIENMYDMSINGYKLFLYCIYNAKPNSDTIVLHPQTCMEICKMKRTSFFQAINELKERNIIRQKEKFNCGYQINPNVLFNGNRLRLK
jgi:hypothetical protein